MSNIEKIFDEIKNEAKTCEIKYNENLYGTIYESTFRMGFNVVEGNNVSKNLFNFYINNYDLFIRKLQEYVYSVSKLYDISLNEDEIKKILILLWANITNEEMLNIDNFVQKYIDFINNNEFNGKCGKTIITDLGSIDFNFDKQSYKQETPYCFNSSFNGFIKGHEVIYHLPRISYGIRDNKCYIYAIQNKEKNGNNLYQEQYGELVRKRMNSLNSGVKKYRNVSPSAITALILFMTILNGYNYKNFEVVCNLPIRHQNRKLVNDFLLISKYATLSKDEYDKVKKIMDDDDIRIRDNTILKFQNNFRRLVNHFAMILSVSPNELNENIFLTINSMDSNNEFINQIVNNIEMRKDNGKSL